MCGPFLPALRDELRSWNSKTFFNWRSEAVDVHVAYTIAHLRCSTDPDHRRFLLGNPPVVSYSEVATK